MSQENVEIVRRAIDQLNETGEPEWSLYTSNLVWTTRADGPTTTTYRGIDGLRRGTASLREVWAEIKAEILELIEVDDTIVSVLRWSLRAQSGVEASNSTGPSRKPSKPWGCWSSRGEVR
jgi:hypothetical protein